MKSLLAITLSSILFVSCQTPNEENTPVLETKPITEKLKETPSYTCENLPSSFSSYSQATSLVKSATYPLSEEVNTLTEFSKFRVKFLMVRCC